MAKTLRILILSLIAFSICGCTSPVEISFDDVCRVENNQKHAIVDGYFSLGASVYCSDTSGDYRCGIVFNQYPDGTEDFSAEVKEGRGRNQMLPLESGFSEEDLKIKSADGSIIGAGEHVRVTGKLLVTDVVCLMYVNKIELINP